MVTLMRLRCLLATMSAVAVACGEPFVPSVDSIAGSYNATILTSTTGGVTTNHLSAGGSFTITLAANGTTTGHLFIPGASALDADMVGTWTLVGNTVQFTQTADTFVRDMIFTASADRLRGGQAFGGTTVRVTLDK